MSNVAQSPMPNVAAAQNELEPPSALRLSFLTWIASGHRTYAETMEAWRTSCPRFTIWEDALNEDLVRLEKSDDAGRRKTCVVLTPRGQSVLMASES